MALDIIEQRWPWTKRAYTLTSTGSEATIALLAKCPGGGGYTGCLSLRASELIGPVQIGREGERAIVRKIGGRKIHEFIVSSL